MALEITDPSGGSLGGSLALTAERGTPSAHIAIKIKNIGALSVDGLFFVMYAEAISGDYVTKGHPAVDERQGRFQITSVDTSGTPGQEAGITTPQAAGHLSNPQLPSILPGNSVFADVWIEQPTTSAGGGAVNIKIEFANEALAFPVEDGVTEVGRGIITGKNSPRSFLIAGRLLTATGTPDGNVHVALGSWLYQGVEGSTGSSSTIALNQNDVAAAALLTGEAYIATISQGLSATPTATKGIKASTTGIGPVAPAIPFGETLLGFVLVNYGSGGSVISGANITESDLSYGRYLVTAPATGLTITVGFGEALTSGYRQARALASDYAVAPSTTSYVWLEYTGTITIETTGLQPSPGAIALATVLAGSSNVTSVTDTRTYIGQAGTLSLHAATHATGGTDPVSPVSIGAASLADIAPLAPIDSPTFTTTQNGVTPTAGDNSTKLATTAYVLAALAAILTEHVATWTSDGTTTTYTLSPVPNSLSIPEVRPGSADYVEGVDYTRTGGSSEVIDWTGHVPSVGVVVVFRWRG